MTTTRLVSTAAALLAGASLLPAAAHASGTKQTLITGKLDQMCMVTPPGDQTFNPTVTTAQSVGSPSYQCNFTGSAKLSFWSQNGGQVISPASSNNGNVAQAKAYSFSFDGNNLGQLPAAANSTAVVTRSVLAPNTAQTGPATIQLTTAATIAGTYTDTIYVSIAP